MYLKRLEIHGFKSFAQKTILDFEPGMTAVVGPNGSGKSNVADALRWVMGEQSMKLLRGKKTEDVIFAGSDKKSKLSMAEVGLTFDNKDHKLPYEYSEVEIKRRVYRNGESEYLVNNQKARLLDIIDALTRSGFGASNYAVIGQGTIDQMILAGPAQIKELIEEASGVKPYYMKRDKTMRRLEQTEENLVQVSALINEIEPRLKSLRRQAKRMEERESLAAELTNLQLEFFGRELHVLKMDLKTITGQAEHKNAQVKKLESETAEFQKTLDKEEKQTGTNDVFLEKLDKGLQTLEEKRLVLLEKLAEVKGKLKVETPVARNFSEFQSRFEKLIQTLTVQNVEQIKKDLQALVAEFGESKDNGELLEQQKSLVADLEKVIEETEEQKSIKHKMQAEEKQKKSFLTVEEKKFREKALELSNLKDELNRILIEQAKVDTKIESLLKEAREALDSHFENLHKFEKGEVSADLHGRITKLKHQIELAGGIDETVLAEYRETEERFNYLSGQSADLTKGVADLKAVIDDLDVVIKKQFDDAYGRISEKFTEYFRILFNGGRAHMSLLREIVSEDGIDQDEEGEETEEEKAHKATKQIVGIEIKATPPGKKLATIAALSGGERALTAIALLCAMLSSYPSPFVVLDEVDAALDEANSIRFAKILSTLAHQTQFITITHNRETMRQGHTLYGVTMGDDGISKILSLKLEQAEAQVRN